MPETPKYWFPAKRFGWGWGPPQTWQGFVVMIVYLALVLAPIPFMNPKRDMVAYLVSMLALSALLILICWKTGEPPTWRG